MYLDANRKRGSKGGIRNDNISAGGEVNDLNGGVGGDTGTAGGCCVPLGFCRNEGIHTTNSFPIPSRMNTRSTIHTPIS